ncbi:cytochrome c3 family protein [Deferrisoma palaeochoriense]
MNRGAWLLVAAVGLGAAVGLAAGGRVLAPLPDQRAGRSGLWLVVEAAEAPRVRVGDRALPVVAAEEGVYHVRIPAEGGRVRAGVDMGAERIMLERSAGEGRGFHPGGEEACRRCHDTAACGECHRWQGETHAGVRAEGCGGCHRGPGHEVDDVAGRCTGCHDDVPKRHRRFRHALGADHDPLRPGRAMDCASCHDPHTPTCLSCLGRPALRGWCKGCHGKRP